MACVSCTKPPSDHFLVVVLKLGKKIQYTVPSFPVFSATLFEIKYQLVNDARVTTFDGYIRACPEILTRSYPALLKLCHGHTNAFTVEPEEFDRCVDLDDEINLCEGLVFIIWKWAWEDMPEDAESTTDGNDSSFSNHEDEDDDTSDHENEMDRFASSLITHSVVFKCIGATKSVCSQEVLAQAAKKLKKAENVEVRLRKEPFNPKDSQAIAFECTLGNDHWERIEYVVREALNSLHHAIEDKSIVKVQFDWIRYITHWSHCDPGWYCGIKITKNGDWPRDVVRCSSTL